MNNYWYNKIIHSNDYEQVLIDALDYFQLQLEEAQKELKISGFLAKEAAELPGLLSYRYNQLQELEALLQFLNIKYKGVKGKAFKRYLEAYSKALTSRDADRYADAEKDVTDLDLLINVVALTRNQFLGIVKGLEAKHWQLNALTKLKVAGFEDTQLDFTN